MPNSRCLCVINGGFRRLQFVPSGRRLERRNCAALIDPPAKNAAQGVITNVGWVNRGRYPRFLSSRAARNNDQKKSKRYAEEVGTQRF